MAGSGEIRIGPVGIRRLKIPPVFLLPDVRTAYVSERDIDPPPRPRVTQPHRQLTPLCQGTACPPARCSVARLAEFPRHSLFWDFTSTDQANCITKHWTT